jgi:hypothetical protein
MKRIFLIIVILLFAVYSKSQINKKLQGFSKIEVFGKINIRLERSTADSIFIKHGSFDISKVSYKIEDSILKIKLLSGFTSVNKVSITIKFKNLATITGGGGCKIYNKGSINAEVLHITAKSGSELDLLINTDSVFVKVNKDAFVRLRGKNNYLQLKTSTGGDFRSTQMTNSTVVATLNGGTAEVDVADFLDVTVRYGASFKFVKLPHKIKRKKQFGGKIGKLEKY